MSDNLENGNYKLAILERQMEVDGIVLKYTAEASAVLEESQDASMTVTHTRKIGDRVYVFKQTFTGNPLPAEEAITTMSQEEVQQFEDDWTRMWTSRIQENGEPQILPALTLLILFFLPDGRLMLP